jgi:hypothetical protein
MICDASRRVECAGDEPRAWLERPKLMPFRIARRKRMISMDFVALVGIARTLRRIVLVGSAAALLAIGVSTNSVDARIKGKDVNGCTQKDLDSPLSKSCAKKEMNRLLNSSKSGIRSGSAGYALLCSAAGNRCCRISEGGLVVPGSCSSTLTGIPVSDRPDTSGGVLDPGPKQRPRRDTISTGGGILDPGPGFGSQGPAATGAPLSTGGGSAPAPGKIN